MRAAQQAILDAERRFPVRIRVAVPSEGLSVSLDRIVAWLDAQLRCGWVDLDSIKRARRRQRCAGHLFRRYNARTAFVARWCVAQKVDILDGVYRVRGDEPTPRVGASRPASSPACRNPEEPLPVREWSPLSRGVSLS